MRRHGSVTSCRDVCPDGTTYLEVGRRFEPAVLRLGDDPRLKLAELLNNFGGHPGEQREGEVAERDVPPVSNERLGIAGVRVGERDGPCPDSVPGSRGSLLAPLKGLLGDILEAMDRGDGEDVYAVRIPDELAGRGVMRIAYEARELIEEDEPRYQRRVVLVKHGRETKHDVPTWLGSRPVENETIRLDVAEEDFELSRLLVHLDERVTVLALLVVLCGDAEKVVEHGRGCSELKRAEAS